MKLSRPELTQSALERLMLANYDLNALDPSEQLDYLAAMYRHYDLDPALGCLVLVDGLNGRQWKRQVFLAKPAVQILKERHQIHLDPGQVVAVDGDFYQAEVTATAPGREPERFAGFSPRVDRDGQVDSYAAARALDAARREAVKAIACVELRWADDLPAGRRRAVDVSELERAAPGETAVGEPRGLEVGVLRDIHEAGVALAVAEARELFGEAVDTPAGGMTKPPEATSPGVDNGTAGAALGSTEREALRRGVQPPALSPGVRIPAAMPAGRAAVGPVPPVVPRPLPAPRGRGGFQQPPQRAVDPRAEAADAIRVGVLRGMATARLPYCYDEASFRRWVGGCLYHYRPEGVDPATLPAAVVEELIAKAGSVAPSLPNPWRHWPLLRRPVRALPELRAEGATRAALERALGVAEVPWADAVEIEDVSDLEVGR